MSKTFDENWDNIYANNKQLNIYPWYDLISFYNKNYGAKRKNTVLEIGCGFGNNIEFMSSFNHEVYGIDASKEVIKKTNKRFSKRNNVHLCHQDFTKIKFKDSFFDFILNRESLTCVSKKNAIKAIGECKKVLKKNGLFYSTFESNMNSFVGETGTDGLTHNLKNYNVNQLRFYNIIEIQEIFNLNNMKIINLYLTAKTDYINKPLDSHSYWTIIAKKK